MGFTREKLKYSATNQDEDHQFGDCQGSNESSRH